MTRSLSLHPTSAPSSLIAKESLRQLQRSLLQSVTQGVISGEQMHSICHPMSTEHCLSNAPFPSGDILTPFVLAPCVAICPGLHWVLQQWLSQWGQLARCWWCPWPWCVHVLPFELNIIYTGVKYWTADVHGYAHAIITCALLLLLIQSVI